MTPVQFPSSLVFKGAPYKVYESNWKYFVDRLIANKWMLEGNHVPLIADYNNLSKNNPHPYLYIFFHPEKREVTAMTQEQYEELGISIFIDFTK